MLNKYDIAWRLQNHAALFRTFWDWSDISYSEQVPTAGVIFDKDSGKPVQILVNENWFNTLDTESQIFVIAHELMHILLNFGERFIKNTNYSLRKANIAGDIVNNEMLVKYLGFNKSTLHPHLQTKGCWLDTVFPNRYDIRPDESTEYYYARIPDNPVTDGFDIHSMTAEEAAQIASDIKDFLDSSGIMEAAVNDELMEQLLKQEAGKGSGKFVNLQKKYIKPKKKWESVVTEWESNFFRFSATNVERWDRVNRRFQDILGKRKDIKLPTQVRIFDDADEKCRIDVFFFLDVSGSCYSFKERFYHAAKSLDENRFNLRLFSFDDDVKELDIKAWRVYGGGGTRFDIIENKVQEVMKRDKIKKYPFVWNLSDGYGTYVKPQCPERWYWFLTKGGSKQYIHSSSKVFNLEDFE